MKTRTHDRYMTAREAAGELGISLATLYSYVSRGMLHSEEVAGQPRVRRYLREDVLRLSERKELRRDPGKAAEKGLHWGSPVLPSSLTLIDGGRFFYRGRDAAELADSASLEEVAALLWTGDAKTWLAIFGDELEPISRRAERLFRKFKNLGAIDRLQVVLPILASADLAAYDLRPGATARTGARILRCAFSAVTGSPASPPLDAALASAWLPKRKSAARALRVALILCADHELNVSAFTARCVASSRATLYEVVIGALAAFRGRRHGAASEDVQILFREAEKNSNYRSVAAGRLRGEGYIPGFGHQLYPGGDPRARVLLSLSEKFGTRAQTNLANRLIEAAHHLTGEHPNLDFGLAAVSRALGLPADAPSAIFALGRTVGWIAHAIEQYADPELIRPRARYIGPAPDQTDNQRDA